LELVGKIIEHGKALPGERKGATVGALRALTGTAVLEGSVAHWGRDGAFYATNGCAT
jgi:hypothetical protein